MKNKTRKLMALLLALVMCLSVLAGCGGNSNSGGNSTGGDNGSSDSQGNNSQGSGSSSQDDGSGDASAVETRKNADIYPLDSDLTFDVVSSTKVLIGNLEGTDIPEMWEDVTGVDVSWIDMTPENVQTALASHEFADAYFMAQGVTKAMATEYGNAGYFIDFKDYLDIMPNFRAACEENPNILALSCDLEGHLYSLPKVGDGPGGYSNLIAMRLDMLHAAGWEELPTTTEEFLQCIKDIQAAFGSDPEFIAFNPGINGFNVDGTGSRCNFFFPAFGELIELDITLDGQGNVVYAQNTEQYKNLLKYMKEIYDSGACNKDVYTTTNDADVAMWTGNKVAAYQTSSITVDNFESGQMEMELLPVLTSEYWSTPHWLRSSGVNTLTWFTAVSTNCQDIETMVRFLDSFYATRENPLDKDGTVTCDSMWMGRWGIDFEVHDDTMTFDYLEHEGYNGIEWQNNMGFNGLNIMTEWMYTADPQTAFGVKGRDTRDKLFPYGVRSYALRSLPLSEDENDTFADIWTDVSTYTNQMGARFITGELDIDAEWDNYVKELDAMGLQDLLDVFQTAYERANS